MIIVTTAIGDNQASFLGAAGNENNTQITGWKYSGAPEMEADCEYKVLLDDVSVGHMKTNLGGKLSFSADLSPDKAVCVEIEKL